MMWHAEAKRSGDNGAEEAWHRISGGPWRSKEPAKGACKRLLEADRHNGHRLAFRIVRDDGLGTVDAESHPPHGWRMRWQSPPPGQRPTHTADAATQAHDDLINAILAAHAGKGRSKPTRLTPTSGEGKPFNYLVGWTASNQGIFLVRGDADTPADLTEEVYEAIVEEAKAASLADHYHVHSKRNLLFSDDVAWHPLPKLS